MPAYVDNMTFGGRSLSGFGTTEKYAGQTYNQTTSLYASIGASGTVGLDLGPVKGNYKDWYHLRLQCLAPFSADAQAGSITFTLYTSDKKETGYEERASIKVPVKSIMKNDRTPFEISLPSDISEFVALGIKLSAAASEETGQILATLEPKRW